MQAACTDTAERDAGAGAGIIEMLTNGLESSYHVNFVG